MKKIDITIPSTLRPGILNKTLGSFCKKMLHQKDRYRLIINIDPVGNLKKTQEDVLNIAKNYFDDVKYNFSTVGHFTQAVIWLWSNTDADYVFHLEDDWAVKKSIDIDYMLSILDRYDKICSVRLSKGAIHGGKNVIPPIACPYIKEEDKGKFTLFPRISLNPTLFRGEFVREAAKVMTIVLNPEAQLVSGTAKRQEQKKQRYLNADKIEDLLSKWDHSVLQTGAIVTDIGREWRTKYKIHREADFREWKEVGWKKKQQRRR